MATPPFIPCSPTCPLSASLPLVLQSLGQLNDQLRDMRSEASASNTRLGERVSETNERIGETNDRIGETNERTSRIEEQIHSVRSETTNLYAALNIRHDDLQKKVEGDGGVLDRVDVVESAQDRAAGVSAAKLFLVRYVIPVSVSIIAGLIGAFGGYFGLPSHTH